MYRWHRWQIQMANTHWQRLDNCSTTLGIWSTCWKSTTPVWTILHNSRSCSHWFWSIARKPLKRVSWRYAFAHTVFFSALSRTTDTLTLLIIKWFSWIIRAITWFRWSRRWCLDRTYFCVVCNMDKVDTRTWQKRHLQRPKSSKNRSCCPTPEKPIHSALKKSHKCNPPSTKTHTQKTRLCKPRRQMKPTNLFRKIKIRRKRFSLFNV